MPDEILSSVADPGAGAILLFLGTVRNKSEAGGVKEMTYEAYAPLAEKKLKELEGTMKRRWPLKKVRLVHRVGRLQLKDISVAVAVSSAHSAEAFEACRFGIEQVKRNVPIWKKEKLTTGTEVWVKGCRIET